MLMEKQEIWESAKGADVDVSSEFPPLTAGISGG
jgi:hypothetical protein